MIYDVEDLLKNYEIFKIVRRNNLLLKDWEENKIGFRDDLGVRIIRNKFYNFYD